MARQPHASSIGRILRAIIFGSLVVGATVSVMKAVDAPTIASAQAPARVDVPIGFRSAPGPAEEALVRSRGG